MKKEDYKKAIFNSGIIPVLLSLSHFERIENFEECAKIHSAIKDWNKLLDEDFLPTRLEDVRPETVLEVMTSLKICTIHDFWVRMATRSFEMTYQPLKHMP